MFYTLGQSNVVLVLFMGMPRRTRLQTSRLSDEYAGKLPAGNSLVGST